MGDSQGQVEKQVTGERTQHICAYKDQKGAELKETLCFQRNIYALKRKKAVSSPYLRRGPTLSGRGKLLEGASEVLVLPVVS